MMRTPEQMRGASAEIARHIAALFRADGVRRLDTLVQRGLAAWQAGERAKTLVILDQIESSGAFGALTAAQTLRDALTAPAAQAERMAA
jgi:hypothetical protein